MSLVKLTDKQVADLKKGCPVIKNKFDIGTAINQIIDYLNGGAAPTITINDQQIEDLNNMCRLKGSNLGTKVKDLLDSAKNHKDVSELNADQVKALNHVCFGLKIAELGQKLGEVIAANNNYHPGPTPTPIPDDYHDYENPVVIYNGNIEISDGAGFVSITEEQFNSVKGNCKIEFVFNNETYIDNNWELPIIQGSELGKSFGNLEVLSPLQDLQPCIYELGRDLPFAAAFGDMGGGSYVMYIIVTDPETIPDGIYNVGFSLLGEYYSETSTIVPRHNWADWTDGESLHTETYDITFPGSWANYVNDTGIGSYWRIPHYVTAGRFSGYMYPNHFDSAYLQPLPVHNYFRLPDLFIDTEHDNQLTTVTNEIHLDTRGSGSNVATYTNASSLYNDVDLDIFTGERTAYQYMENEVIFNSDTTESYSLTPRVAVSTIYSDSGYFVDLEYHYLSTDIAALHEHLFHFIRESSVITGFEVNPTIDSIEIGIKLHGDTETLVKYADSSMLYMIEYNGGVAVCLGYDDARASLIASEDGHSDYTYAQRKAYFAEKYHVEDKIDALKISDTQDLGYTLGSTSGSLSASIIKSDASASGSGKLGVDNIYVKFNLK